MPEDLNILAQRANITLKNEAGFLRCSAAERALHFEFDTLLNAEGFKFRRELGGGTFPMIVSGTTVIEARK